MLLAVVANFAKFRQTLRGRKFQKLIFFFFSLYVRLSTVSRNSWRRWDDETTGSSAARNRTKLKNGEIRLEVLPSRRENAFNNLSLYRAGWVVPKVSFVSFNE